ncbi:hypothetical protein H0H87_012051 [Tephrocybe sp. NHM501043]|nr:hypothetical protein H0H87_012051 [Tephrocybe sp. NHM501043]
MKLSTAVLGALSGLLTVPEATLASHTVSSNHTSTSAKSAPNFVFVITDDQDLELESVSYTPLIQKHLGKKGTFFKNHFVTTAICCPSRVALWTGRQPHNTNVTDVSPPYGGYPKFIERGFNSNFLPVWLQQAGYNTYYTGKLFNAHTVLNYNNPFVAGFTGSDFLLDPFTYSYYNSSYQRNQDPPVSYAGRHTTEVTTEKALGFLDDAIASGKPFFLTAAPIAPHAAVEGGNVGGFTEPIPLPQHANLFPNVTVPRTKHFNPDKPSGVSWIRNLPKQDQATLDYNDHYYRQRLRSLQGVDELVDSIVARLEKSGLLDNTYIIYTSDNGYHIGQHRLPPGKTCGFEEDIRVPLFIRGPGVAAGREETAVTTHIDLAPTIFDLAGIPLRDDFDGAPIPVNKNSHDVRHEHVTVEFWGSGIGEGVKGNVAPGNSAVFANNTYKSVRLIGEGYNLYYSVWCSNEHELYDLSTDPYQLNNLFSTDNTTSSHEPRLLGHTRSQVISRLDALLLVLKSCKGETCIKPWNVLHPNGSVKNLRDALSSTYDAFYTRQHKVSFDRCELGYIIDSEGPQTPLTYRHDWDLWT